MEAWMTAAACRGVPVAIFFPERGEPAAPAREICAGCSCLAACRTFALSADAPEHGIIAGWTSKERARLRAELKRDDIRMSSATPRRRRGSGPELLPSFPRIVAGAAPLTTWTRGELLEARATPG